MASSIDLDQHAGSTQAEQQLVPMPQEEREMIEQVVEALHVIDLGGLPVCPTADTIRGLVWALEYAISPKIQPRCQHPVPFNLSFSKAEEALGQGASNEVWKIIATLLVGLGFLETRGVVSRSGVECPASWSPGDLSDAIEEARDSLVRLEALNDKLCSLECGTVAEDTDTRV